jgi:hypothetical protein
MQTRISLSQVCDHFHIDFELVRDFADFGLYPTVLFDGELGIEAQDLARLGKIISLHQSLGINKEGIDVILDLREKITALESEAELLRNEVEKLRRHFESEGTEVLRRRGLLIEISG